MIRKLLNKIFKYENISGNGRCPTYLHRWTLLRIPAFAVYLHHFVGDDWALDLHDHPKDFISIGLRGQYDEVIEGRSFPIRWRAPWVRGFPAEHRHRIEASDCWTIVIVGRPRRFWGFWCDGAWVSWQEYVYSKLPEARGAVACK